MNDVARALVETAARRFGESAFRVQSNDRDPDAGPRAVILVFPHPSESRHRIEITQRNNTFEVAYSDGLPPGPAEQLFVGDERDRMQAAVDSVITFVADIIEGRTVVWRQRLGPITRLLRRRDCDSVLRFGHYTDVNPAWNPEVVALYAWR